jgi:cytochrome c553
MHTSIIGRTPSKPVARGPVRPKPVHLGVVPLTLAASLLNSVAARAADEAKLRSYGAHLAQECTACHRVDGADHNGIPSITGWDVEAFMRTLRLYQQGTRTNPVMGSVAKSLDDDQLHALALYWASVPKPAAKAEPKSRK